MYCTVSMLLHNEGIDICKQIPLKYCKVTKGYLLEKHDITDENATVFIFAIPYLAPSYSQQNISSYAVPKDYHLFVKELGERVLPHLKSAFPDNKFAIFADHSPIDERHAAVLAGLGVFGKNGTVISERYSSFFFIAEIITDAPCASHDENEFQIKSCISCGKCIKACPLNMCDCLSAITQKKGQLLDFEINLILTHRCAWGCDICQNVCPYTSKAIEAKTIYTHIPFFLKDRTPYLTKELILNMDDNHFLQRAYSWRGKACILRNLEILESTNGLAETSDT